MTTESVDTVTNAEPSEIKTPLLKGDVPPLVPARMLNEFAYCPRLAYLEWSQGEWEESADTVDGSRVHRRVDTAEGPRAKFHHHSVALSSETLGLTAVIDLIESDGKRARPIDYKRGKKPQVAGGAWEPEKVQLCAQGLLLREQGYECHEGVLYFAGSRERVRVRFTEAWSARSSFWARCERACAAQRFLLRWRTAPSVRAARWSPFAFPTK